MRCHVCNVAVGDAQRFCHECGESLAGVTDPTELLPAIDDDTLAHVELTTDEAPPDSLSSEAVPAHRGELPDLAATPTESIEVRDEEWWADDPDARPDPDPDEMTPPPTEPMEVVGSKPQSSAATARNRLDSIPDDSGRLDPLTGDETQHGATTVMATTPAVAGGRDATSVMAVTPADAGRDTDEPAPVSSVGATTQIPAVFDGAHQVEQYAVGRRQGFRLRMSFVLGLLAVVAAVMVSIADVVDIRTSRPVDGIDVGLRTLDDIGTNLAVAGLIGTGTMLLGGLLSCVGLRWGAGLAGGGGLATLGWAVMTIGLVEVPINGAQQITRGSGVEVNEFVLSVTRDLGWFLLVAIGIVGAIVFLVTLRMAGTGARPGLNPWIAAVGALGTVIVAAGPLIPLGGAQFDVNLGTGDFPREFFAARLVQLALIAATGVLGFLSVRTYGLGLAAGGLAVSVWLWITTLAGFGDAPVGIGVGNIGTSDTTPHAVTSVGMTATLVMLAVAATLALLGRDRT